MPPEIAALIGCSVATGVGAVLNTAGVRAGESAVVVGCGGVGQAIVLGLVLVGADPIVAVDLDAGRREQALALGATRAVAAAEGEFDHAFEAIGREATLAALPGLLARGGQAVIVGMPAEGVRVAYDPFDLADQGKRIVGCNYGSSVPAVDFPRLARLHLAGRLPLEKLVGRAAVPGRGRRRPGRPARRRRPAHGAGAMRPTALCGSAPGCATPARPAGSRSPTSRPARA